MPETLERRSHALEQRQSGDYHLSFESVNRRVRVIFNGVAIADSRRAMLLHETRHPPVYYFPREDVRMDCLDRSTLVTYCPFKGDASYWSVIVGERAAADTAWSYEKALRRCCTPFAAGSLSTWTGSTSFGTMRQRRRRIPATPRRSTEIQ